MQGNMEWRLTVWVISILSLKRRGVQRMPAQIKTLMFTHFPSRYVNYTFKQQVTRARTVSWVFQWFEQFAMCNWSWPAKLVQQNSIVQRLILKIKHRLRIDFTNKSKPYMPEWINEYTTITESNVILNVNFYAEERKDSSFPRSFESFQLFKMLQMLFHFSDFLLDIFHASFRCLYIMKHLRVFLFAFFELSL